MRPKCTRACLNCHNDFTYWPSRTPKYCSRACMLAHKDMRTSGAAFWRRVDRSAGPNACWEWSGARNNSGYGRVMFRGLHTTAHRTAYTLTHGPVPDGLNVLHTCDNRACCNPAHLWLGTIADNSRDMCLKGRAHTTLTLDAVRAIRREYAEGGTTYRALATRYGVSHMTVAHVVTRNTWKHHE
jgi:hypothetical protein